MEGSRGEPFDDLAEQAASEVADEVFRAWAEVDELDACRDTGCPGRMVVVVGSEDGDFEGGVDFLQGGDVVVDNAFGTTVFVVLGDKNIIGGGDFEFEARGKWQGGA